MGKAIHVQPISAVFEHCMCIGFSRKQYSANMKLMESIYVASGL